MQISLTAKCIYLSACIIYCRKVSWLRIYCRLTTCIPQFVKFFHILSLTRSIVSTNKYINTICIKLCSFIRWLVCIYVVRIMSCRFASQSKLWPIESLEIMDDFLDMSVFPWYQQQWATPASGYPSISCVPKQAEVSRFSNPLPFSSKISVIKMMRWFAARDDMGTRYGKQQQQQHQQHRFMVAARYDNGVVRIFIIP